jgi:hypothetical protein
VCGQIISKFEKLAWEELKTHFDIQDYFDFSGKLKFTWNNLRKDGIRVLASLNKVYIPKMKCNQQNSPIL